MIGILGGYGRIGLQVSKKLYETQGGRIKIGGRKVEPKLPGLKEVFPKAEFCKVDLSQERTIREFAKGCRLLINCAGAAERIFRCLCAITSELEIPYIETGWSHGYIQRRTAGSITNSVVYGVGIAPGLSEVLAEYMGEQNKGIQDFTLFYKIRDQFTRRGARDYLEEIIRQGDQVPYCIHDGQKIIGGKYEKKTDLFDDSLVLPFFNCETERLFQKYQYQNACWSMVCDGFCLSRALKGISGHYYRDAESAVTYLCESAQLDLEDCGPQLCFYLETKVKNQYKSLYIAGEQPVLITAEIVRWLAGHMLEGGVDPGIQALSQVPLTLELPEVLRRSGVIGTLLVYEGRLEELFAVESGEI